MFPIPLKTLSDQQRHDYILQTFVLNRAATANESRHKRDIDIIKEHHRFLWNSDDDDEASVAPETWEERLARRYYDKLFKEYCIADLTRHKENKVALRWRVEAEVVAGKGQFQCGSRKCEERENLRTWEVNFAYQEHGERKNALVKLRLCPEHSAQLNYTSRKREVKRLKRVERHQAKETKRRRRNASSSKGYEQDTIENDVEDVAAATLQQSSNEAELLEQPDRADVDEDEQSEELHEAVVAAEVDVWSKKQDLEVEPNTRETDFERYLEDLLL